MRVFQGGRDASACGARRRQARHTAQSSQLALHPSLWRAPQGVRVCACPLFIPELTQASEEERQYFFAYRQGLGKGGRVVGYDVGLAA